MTETPLSTAIHTTLLEASPALRLLKDDWYVIGAAAMVLAGVQVPHTADVDLLVSGSDASLLQTLWEGKRDKDFAPPFADRFRSVFSRYRFTLMDIEVMGNLEINKADVWTPLRIVDFTQVEAGGLSIRIPTRAEQVKILRFFGREKDLAKIAWLA